MQHARQCFMPPVVPTWVAGSPDAPCRRACREDCIGLLAPHVAQVFVPTATSAVGPARVAHIVSHYPLGVGRESPANRACRYRTCGFGGFSEAP